MKEKKLSNTVIHPTVKRTQRCLRGWIGIPFIIVDLLLLYGLIDMFFYPPIVSDYIIIISAIVLVSCIAFFAIAFGHNINTSREDYWELEEVTDIFLDYIKPAVLTWGSVVVIIVVLMMFVYPYDSSSSLPVLKHFFVSLYAGGVIGALFGIVFCGLPMTIANRGKIIDLSFVCSFGFAPLTIALIIIFHIYSVLYYSIKILVKIIIDMFKMYRCIK